MFLYTRQEPELTERINNTNAALFRAQRLFGVDTITASYDSLKACGYGYYLVHCLTHI